jgi:small GTP-binding protein
MSYDGKCQLLIIGDSTVGKTSILGRYANGVFNANYLATIGLDNFTKDEVIDNKTIRIKIWDTAGQEKYQSLTKGFFRNAQGIMVVFDVTNSETYEDLKYWTQSIKTHMGSDIDKISVIIIGNKIDSNEREVRREDAEVYCQELGYPYFETSAKTGENVDETIKYLVKQVLKKSSICKNKLNYSDNSIRISKNKGEGNCPC